MNGQTHSMDRLLKDLQERAKELNCLYKIEDLLHQSDLELFDIFKEMVKILPEAWQFSEICHARIIFENKIFASAEFELVPWMIRSDITVHGEISGAIEIYYMEERPHADEGPFLKEEVKLLHSIAERLGHSIFYKKHRQVMQGFESAQKLVQKKGEWRVVLDLLRATDQNLFIIVSRKMTHYLVWSGVKEASDLLQKMGDDQRGSDSEPGEDENRPSQKTTLDFILSMSNEIFRIASENLSDSEILSSIQKWIQEDKSSFLIKTMETYSATLSDIIEALTRFQLTGQELSPHAEIGLGVSLIRRFFFDRLDFINVAKKFIQVKDFYDLLQRVIFPTGSHGKLGGKSAGLFLASRILKRSPEYSEILSNIKTPKTWYITSDGILDFIRYNNLEEVIEQKYKEIEQVRLEYPQIIQIFKNSHFPPEIIKGLSMALDDFQEKPLIVRSSSLLEDSLGTAFSGKYKSLFLANQGPKNARMEALMDAIAEVYASTFGPDPIQYRAERGLLDFHEEMGIMIQEVVGVQMGDYFLPTFAGVAFSNNEFRWSPRIKREDGLIRLVPGLGTRAVDRVSNDYPILLAPGQPNLRVNASVEEIVRYSPQKIDIINMRTNTFETVEITDLFRKFGESYPRINNIVSIFEDNRIRKPAGLGIDFEKDSLIVTFDGMINNTLFVSQLHSILKLLQEKLGSPVDIEFAADGNNFYLLQCRPQSYTDDTTAAPIPKDISKDKIVFTANRYISNGKMPEITHVVYVDPAGYAALGSVEEMASVGRAVAKLNKLLPKRQFILIGPGRWGSRGDIKLGVSVTYSDFNNTAMLVEIARQKGNYVPELSFGTHFFQDLVESSIRYLPLYPDDPGMIFNERFLLKAPNILIDILPEYAHLVDVLHVIDVPRVAEGLVLRILMNADLSEAMGYLSMPQASYAIRSSVRQEAVEQTVEDYWTWRMRMAEKIASQVAPGQFGIKAMYVIGSTKNATAGPGSDIDLLIHFNGLESERQALEVWLDGWSLCLGEVNYLRTGYKTLRLLDVHIITDEDIAQKTSYAIKIGAITDPARNLPLKRS